MGEMLPPFTTSFNASLTVDARPERLTGEAGAVLVREVIERTGIIEWMTARLPEDAASDHPLESRENSA